MLTAAPNPRSVLPPPVALPFCTEETPACKVARAAQSRPFNGVSRTVDAFALPQTEGHGSLTSAGGAVTCAAGSALPACMTTFRMRSTPAVTVMAVHSWVTYPFAETVISKFPGDKSGILKKTAGLVVAVLEAPVLRSVTVMRASGIAPPDSLVTV